MHFDFFESKFICDIQVERRGDDFEVHLSKPLVELAPFFDQNILLFPEVVFNHGPSISSLQKFSWSLLLIISIVAIDYWNNVLNAILAETSMLTLFLNLSLLDLCSSLLFYPLFPEDHATMGKP